MDPGGIVLIVLPDAVIEVARQAADGLLVADIGRPQAARREPAQVIRRLDEHDALAHPLGLNRRDDAGRRAAVNDDVDVSRSGSFRRARDPLAIACKIAIAASRQMLAFIEKLAWKVGSPL